MRWLPLKLGTSNGCFFFAVMAFVTYILLAGVVLGTNNRYDQLHFLFAVGLMGFEEHVPFCRASGCRFTPEQLGITCSTALVWLVIEILLLLLVMYILNVTTDLKYLDLLAYCGYKYVG